MIERNTPVKNILLLIVFAQLLSSCQGQTNEAYWKSEKVTKVDNKPFWGVTSSYMDMVAAMQIHLSSNNDSLIFHYPYEKKIKISDLQSLTNCRSSTGQLLDSVYEVKIEGDELKIKFQYIGTGDEENKFVLNLIKIEKKEFIEEVERLKTEKKKLQDLIKPIDLSTLDLSTSKPAYFNSDIDLNQLNSIALAEELGEVEGSFSSKISKNESFKVKDSGFKYNYYNIQNSDKIASSVANIGAIKFNNLAFVTNETDSKNKAIVLTHNDLHNQSIEALYSIIASKMKGPKIRGIGLPEGSNDISKIFGVAWKQEDKTVKLLIETPEDLYYEETDKNFTLPTGENNPHSEKDILKVFNHYLSLTKKAKVRIIIVSNAFDELLKADNFNAKRLQILNEEK